MSPSPLSDSLRSFLAGHVARWRPWTARTAYLYARALLDGSLPPLVELDQWAAVPGVLRLSPVVRVPADPPALRFNNSDWTIGIGRLHALARGDMEVAQRYDRLPGIAPLPPPPQMWVLEEEHLAAAGLTPHQVATTFNGDIATAAAVFVEACDGVFPGGTSLDLIPDHAVQAWRDRRGDHEPQPPAFAAPEDDPKSGHAASLPPLVGPEIAPGAIDQSLLVAGRRIHRHATPVRGGRFTVPTPCCEYTVRLDRRRHDIHEGEPASVLCGGCRRPYTACLIREEYGDWDGDDYLAELVCLGDPVLLARRPRPRTRTTR